MANLVITNQPTSFPGLFPLEFKRKIPSNEVGHNPDVNLDIYHHFKMKMSACFEKALLETNFEQFYLGGVLTILSLLTFQSRERVSSRKLAKVSTEIRLQLFKGWTALHRISCYQVDEIP